MPDGLWKNVYKNKQIGMPLIWSRHYLVENLGDFPKTLKKVIQERFNKKPRIKKTC